MGNFYPGSPSGLTDENKHNYKITPASLDGSQKSMQIFTHIPKFAKKLTSQKKDDIMASA